MRNDPAHAADRLPLEFPAKDGRPLRVCRLDPEEGQSLVRMYLDFKPRNSFNGLPPIRNEVCVDWVRQMLHSGTNVVAQAEGAVVAHMALFAITARKCEMLVVVAPALQNLGVGTRLTRCAVTLAGQLGFEQIWLPVDATNVRARHIYAKCGFEYLTRKPAGDLDMAIDVPKVLAARGPHALPMPAMPPANAPVARR